MLTLKNEFLQVSIAEKGAEIKSLNCNGKEILWGGNPSYWAGTAPVLFPICGGLKDNTYFLNGKSYSLIKHGFARHKIFKLEAFTETSATYLLTHDEETLKSYPYNFEFRIVYTLVGKKVSVEYRVTNTNSEVMYFSVGAHEGYACEGGIQNYEIVLPEPEKLYHYNIDGVLLGEKTDLILDNQSVLPLDYKYFAVDALAFKDIKARSVVLRNRLNGQQVKVCFEGFTSLLLWTVPNAEYICIEPWCGIPDRTFTNQNFPEKEGIEKAEPGQTFTRTHSIEVL